jgi:glyoxylase-like metal-dependent hydrolase (beta-lactamase superfamily II)
VGGDRKIQDMSNCKIMVHEKGAEIIEKGNPQLTDAAPDILKFQTVHVNKRLRDNDTLKIGNHEFQILHTPGHSDDSICILMEETYGRALFTGDTAWAFGQPGVFPLGARSDLRAYYESIERVSKLKIDILFPGHTNFILSDASEHIDHLLTKLSGVWSDFVLHPPHPFWPTAMIRRKLVAHEK